MEVMKLTPRKTRAIHFTLTGMFFMLLSYGIAVYDPLEMLVNKKLEMKEGSFLFGLWQKPPLDVYIIVYAFNVTNSEEFLSGKDEKLKLEEVGPFVYQEFLEHHEPTFNENGTLSFKPKRHHVFQLDRSIGDPKDFILTVPNIPYIGASAAANSLGLTASFGLRALTTTMNIQPFLNLTAEDFLWGYEDPLITMIRKYMPHFLPFDKFGILDRMFDEGENSVTINLPQRVNEIREQQLEKEKSHSIAKRFLFDSGRKKTIYEPEIRDYSVDVWNGSPGLSQWGYEKNDNKPCNTIRGAYDVTIFPQNISESEMFYLYRPAFCRTLPVVFSHSGKLWGLDAYWFRLASNAFESYVDDPNSSCYCPENKCLRRGLGDITPCYYGIPTALSYPHFYKSDHSLLTGVEGLVPNGDKHESEIIIQPRLGIPIRVNSRFQLNLVVDSIRLNKKLKKFENTAIPIMWAEMAIYKLSPHLEFMLNLLFHVAPYAQIGVIVIFGILGLSLIAFSIILCCFVPEKPNTLYPKQNIRYSAVNMLPYIKRGLELYGEKIVEEELETLS